ncbi:MAG: hypothetical protein IJZ57_11165 [Clostridia bacterium]|nr:hypothetical protein [Clostridia bacterium]
MKKILSILLCVVIAFGSMSAMAITKEDCNDYPVIIVPGYGSTTFYMLDENGEKYNVWKPTGDQILDVVKENLFSMGKGLAELTTSDIQALADMVGEVFISELDTIACNDDGSSKHQLYKYHFSAADTQDSYLKENDPANRMEGEICDYLAQYIGNDNIFAFMCDFRMGSVYCAEELDAYIQDVKKFTGKDKVNIFAVSHGGQVAGTYLSIYGTKGDVENAVLTIPALGGALLAYDIMSQNVKFDEELLLRFVQCGMMLEEDYNWLFQLEALGFLDTLINALIPYIGEVAFNWGSLWDFIPTEYYEELKAELLDETANAEIIRKSDYMHYEIMPNYAENFKKAQAAGTNISIIAGYGVPSVTGSQENSDAIISTKASTGAKVAPFGQRFADGYTQEVDTGIYQVSPGMEIDASCGYLPYNTWYIEGYFHGMTFKDVFSQELTYKLLLTDRLEDVTSDADYPQFHATTNPYEPAFARFNNSVEGYVSDDDTSLIVTNVSTKSNMTILAIKNNLGLEFDNLAFTTLAPGESAELEFTGELPEESAIKREIYISYVLDNNITPVGERKLSFTVMNGGKAEYDSENPYSPFNAKTELENLVGDVADGILDNIGIKPFVSIIVNILTSWISAVFAEIGINF